jgi:transposase-like protein
VGEEKHLAQEEFEQAVKRDVEARVREGVKGRGYSGSGRHDFERDVPSHVAASAMSEVAEDLEAIFKLRREKTARALAEEFAELYEKRFAKAISVFEAGVGDVLAYLRYPGCHHARMRSANMSKRSFREVGRRTKVVRVFPNQTSASTLATEIMPRGSEEEWALKRYLTMDALEAGRKAELTTFETLTLKESGDP